LFATNAMNFIDGLNGLCAGTALVAAGFLAFIAQQQEGWFVYFAALLLATGLAGFLPFNFPRARIFMGDVGSQFCGFMLALFGIAAARYEAAPLSFLLIPLLLSGVLFDVAFTLVRRAIAGDNLTQAHRSHLYQIAQRSGMDARLVALIHWGFVLIGGAAAAGFLLAPDRYKLPVALMPLLVQIIWAIYVAGRARRADLGQW
jgi:UDP-GlcNAc:undecaprenyl-phosphate GlcNAc-1-phosphate transferase